MSREENVFGLDVRVNSRAEMLQQLADGERVIFGVTRCADLPAAGIPEPIRSRNRYTSCDGCSELCWYDPMYAVPGVTVLCLHCLPAGYRINTVEEQVGELRRLFPGR